MDMSGEYRIPAPRQMVWQALNDPEILKQAIPGCDELIKTSDTEMSAKVTAKVGPVKAKFAGDVRLENINAPESYSIVGEGKGGAAGFAKGGADVHLREDGNDTVLTYTAKAEVGGKLAQIGSRLIQGTSKKMADQFFGKFSEIVGSSAQATAGAAPAPEPALPAEAPKPPEAATPVAAPTTVEAPKPAQPAPTAATARPSSAPPASKPETGGSNKMVTIAIVVVIVLLLLYALW